MKRRIAAAIVVIGIGIAGAAQGVVSTIYGLTANRQLLRFPSNAPGSTVLVGNVVVGVGETPLTIDFRPADERLYMLTRDSGGNGRIYGVSTTNAAASLLAVLTPDAPGGFIDPYSNLSAAHFDMDFDPVTDRLRIVGDDGTNLRVDPVSWFVTTDAPLNYLGGGTPQVAGVAYSRNLRGATSTVLYDIDYASDTLNTQNSPNSGTLIELGPMGADVGADSNLDIVSFPNGANDVYASLTVGGVTRLYAVNPATGSVNSVGAILAGTTAVNIAVQPDVIFINGFQ